MRAPEDRRTRIADAVITVLAERGSRGLTHRAVDEVAGLATGSTSYYVRSRAALLEAAVPRLVELDARLLDASDGSDLHLLLLHVFADALQGPGRERTLARYELMLESVRRPNLRAALAAGTTRLVEHLTRAYPGDAPKEAQARARDAMAYLDGLLLANVTAPPEQTASPKALADRVARFMDRDHHQERRHATPS